MPNHVDEQYLRLLESVFSNGVDKKNRTGVVARSIFGSQLIFDLSEGFPILTTKKVHFKSVAEELLFFLRGETNVKSLNEKGVTIWDEWADGDGELGKIYGYQWINWENNKNIVSVEPRVCNHVKDDLKIELQKPEIDEKDDFVGRQFKSLNSGDFIVLKRLGLIGNCSKYEIQFLQTGYVKSAYRDAINNGEVKDICHPRIFDVGCCGETKLETELDKNIKRIWRGMLDRCYNKNCKAYKNYGEKGIRVCPKWHNFDNFYNDVKKLPQWYLKKNNFSLYDLDKDYYQSKCYCPDTCVWLSRADNVLYNTSKPFEVFGPDGKNLGIEISITECKSKYGLTDSHVSRVLLGKCEHHKKFKFKYLEDNKIYRYQLPTNQIADVIEKIKTNPDDRRLIVSAWNVSDLKSMKLPPCHMIFEFNVCEDKLNCMFFMRSIDVFLGLPFNIASYALLTHMVAHVCGLKPGNLVWCGGDTHIYNNHFDQVKEQLSRTPFDLPILKINPNIKNIFDFKFTDFELIDYKCHPSIKAPIAV